VSVDGIAGQLDAEASVWDCDLIIDAFSVVFMGGG